MSISIGDTEVYTVEEVAELFDITERTVRDMLGRGELKGRKLARRWYITAGAIEERLQPDEAEQTAPTSVRGQRLRSELNDALSEAALGNLEEKMEPEDAVRWINSNWQTLQEGLELLQHCLADNADDDGEYGLEELRDLASEDAKHGLDDLLPMLRLLHESFRTVLPEIWEVEDSGSGTFEQPS